LFTLIENKNKNKNKNKKRINKYLKIFPS